MVLVSLKIITLIKICNTFSVQEQAEKDGFWHDKRKFSKSEETPAADLVEAVGVLGQEVAEEEVGAVPKNIEGSEDREPEDAPKEDEVAANYDEAAALETPSRPRRKTRRPGNRLNFGDGEYE